MAHGSKWTTFCNSEDEIMNNIRSLVEQGELLEGSKDAIPEGGYGHIRSGERPLSTIATVRNTGQGFEFASAYPVPMDVAMNDLEVHSIEPATNDEDEFEKNVRAITRDGSEIAFFCPAFSFFEPTFESAKRFRFGLGAIAYTLEKAPSEIEITEGDFFEHAKKCRMEEDPNFDPATFTAAIVRMDTLRCYIEREEGDFEFQSVVEEITPFSFLSANGYIMLINLIPEDRVPIMVKLYASQKVLGSYTPQVGDPIRGVAGLQGVPLEAILAEELWMDSSEAAHEGGKYDGIMEGVSWMFANDHLPMGLQAIGGAFVRAGWNITYIEDRFFRDEAPAFIVERDTRRYWVFVRTGISDFCQPSSWSEEGIKNRVQAALSRDAQCLHLTVNLEPEGKSFEVSVDGLGELSEEIQPSLSLRRPEYLEPVQIGNEERPEPVLDEAVAATTFAQCITDGDLAELSRMLVEDLDFVSECIPIQIKGRQQFLAYLGNHLSQWKDDGVTVKGTASTAVINGEQKPCVFSYCNDKKDPFACTVFSGRRGHIAAIRNIDPATLSNI